MRENCTSLEETWEKLAVKGEVNKKDFPQGKNVAKTTLLKAWITFPETWEEEDITHKLTMTREHEVSKGAQWLSLGDRSHLHNSFLKAFQMCPARQ